MRIQKQCQTLTHDFSLLVQYSMLIFYYQNKGDNIMARGKKNYTLEEKLEIVNKDIENTKLCLQKLEEKKKELEEQIRQNKLEEIDKMMTQNGKTFDDVMAFLVG